MKTIVLGIARFRDKVIAPLFSEALGLENVCLPESFAKAIKLYCLATQINSIFAQFHSK